MKSRQDRGTLSWSFPLLPMQSACSNTGCAIVRKLVLLLLTLAELAALMGVYKSHFVSAGTTFGSTTGSLSLIAFAITTAVWLHVGTMHCSSCKKG